MSDQPPPGDDPAGRIGSASEPHDEADRTAVNAPTDRSGPDHRFLKRRGARQPQAGPRRALWVGGIWLGLLTLCLLALLGRVVQLQVDPPEPITQRLDTHQVQRKLLARRGTLRDREGRVLAASRIAQRLFVDAKLIEDRLTFEERVAEKLNYNPIRLEKKLHRRPGDRYIVIDKRLSDQKLARFEDMDEPGLGTTPTIVRDYPNGDLAGPIVGFVGEDGHGLEGLEAVFDDKLIGEPGRYHLLRDSRRRPLWMREATHQPARSGPSVRLSLDVVIQRIAERELQKAVDHYRAASGMLVAIDPKTGEILAMANAPDYNPNTFAEVPKAHRRNRCVTDVFEPGSIFKPIVWSALTELDLAQPKETINCTQGAWTTSFGRTLHDAHGMGPITWNKVLVLSSNIGMGKVAMRTDNQTLHHIVESFGFGHTTDAALPGEVKGLVNPLARWNEYSQTSIPMGQEIGVTALQMTRAFAVFANGGLLVEPTIQKRNAKSERKIVRRVLPRDTADRTRRVLRRVVTEGTGRKAKSDKYRLFGKTGTAQLPNFEQGGYYDDQYMASFVGGAPVDQPRLVVGCFIRKPDPEVGHYGGIVAAPVVTRVIEQSLRCLDVPTRPQKDESQLAQRP